MSIQSPFTNPETARLLYRTAWAMAVTTALFCIVLGSLLLVSFIQVKRSDPLNTPKLIELRQQAVKDPTLTEVKQQVRELDLLARKAYFAGQEQLRNGAILLVCGAAIIVALLNLAAVLRQHLPNPDQFPILELIWQELSQRRLALIIAALVFIGFAFTAGLLAKSDLTFENIQQALSSASQPKAVPEK